MSNVSLGGHAKTNALFDINEGVSAQPGLGEGCLLVEFVDKNGVPLPGFTQADCVPVKGDHDAIQVHWAGGDHAPRDAQKAKFYLKRAFLYGFEFRGGRANGGPQKE